MPLICLFALLTVITSCAREPRFCPRTDKQPFGFGKDWVTNSDSIIVAKISAIRLIEDVQWGKPARTLRLYEVGFNQAHSLKGDLQGRTTFFVYVDESFEPRNMRPAFDLTLGSVAIFFLREESGRLRPIQDVLDYRIGLSATIIPRSQSLTPKQSTEYYLGYSSEDDMRAGFRIANAVLAAPPENAAHFISKLPYYTIVAEQATSARYTAQLLLVLTHEKNRPIANAACLRLAELYAGQSACLERTDDLSPTVLDDLRSRLSAADPILLRGLKTNPMRSLTAVDSRMAILDRLQLLRDHPNPTIRKAACSTIDRFYPEVHIDRCSDPSNR